MIRRINLVQGIGLLEVVIATGILGALVASIMYVSTLSIKASRSALNESRAQTLLAEGYEITRQLRDKEWSNISSLVTSSTYYFASSTNSTTTYAWKATTTKSMIDKFYVRTLIVKNVYRDENDDIAPTGTLDTGTKKFTLSVSWPNIRSATSTITVDFYLA